jgi:hypothetical protein
MFRKKPHKRTSHNFVNLDVPMPSTHKSLGPASILFKFFSKETTFAKITLIKSHNLKGDVLSLEKNIM